MAYFKPYIDVEGVHIPTYQDALDLLIESYKAIFGEDVYIAEDSPDYQLLSVFTRCLDDYVSFAVDCYNARNINYASGNSLDLLLPLAGLTRKNATASTVNLTLSGTIGTVIPAGSKVMDDDGYLWDTTAEATLAAASVEDTVGTATVAAECETKGAISALAGTIKKIYTPLAGWDGVNNAFAASVGKDIETDEQARVRFGNAVLARSAAVATALRAALFGIENVKYVKVYENDTGSTDANNIPGHSIACIVGGGNQNAIAQMIYEKKAPGIGTYGSTAVSVSDEYGQTHTINFSRPTSVLVYFNIWITTLAGYDGDTIEEAIRNAIVNHINENGIGESLIISQLYGICYASRPDLASTYIITAIQATVAGGSATSSVVNVAWNERIVLQNGASSITFTTTSS